LRDNVKAAIETAVETLLPLKRAGGKAELPVEEHVSAVVAAAGGPAPFIEWVNRDPAWRFNAAEAPDHVQGKPAALADYVAKSILEELLVKQAAKEAKERRS
jgi:hypothetical protein